VVTLTESPTVWWARDPEGLAETAEVVIRCEAGIAGVVTLCKSPADGAPRTLDVSGPRDCTFMVSSGWEVQSVIPELCVLSNIGTITGFYPKESPQT